jgi:UDP-3-O-[3-hydroxymyristoyl] glucosamine N-acyltransferase
VGEHAVLGAGVSVGDGTRIGAGAVIEAGTRIGRGCHIQPGAVIGVDGYGFVRDRDGRPRRFPYLGRVVLEDGVQVGANTCIARGHIQDTLIRSETLIDTLCHIGHNADVGPRALLISRCVIGGTARIGAEAFVGMGALVSDSLTVGRGATVGMGAVVMKDVPEGATVMGRGAVPLPPSDAGLPERYRL